MDCSPQALQQVGELLQLLLLIPLTRPGVKGNISVNTIILCLVSINTPLWVDISPVLISVRVYSVAEPISE